MRRRRAARRGTNVCPGADPFRKLPRVLVRFGRGRRRLRASPRALKRWRGVLGSLFRRQADFNAQEKSPRAARSGDYGSRFGLAGPQGIRAAFWAPVIIRFPRTAANELLPANVYLESPAPPPRLDMRVYIARSALQDGFSDVVRLNEGISGSRGGRHYVRRLSKSYWSRTDQNCPRSPADRLSSR